VNVPHQANVYVAATLIAFGTALALTVILRSLAADSQAQPRGSSTAQPRGGSQAQPGGGSTAQPRGGSTAQPGGGSVAQPGGGSTAQPGGGSVGGRLARPRRGTSAGPGDGASTRRPAPRPRRRRTSPRTAIHEDYGLLRILVLVENLETGRSVRALLAAGGVRSTIATGPDGLVRVLVFPEAYERARRMISWVL
jgi:hypothetical protein